METAGYTTRKQTVQPCLSSADIYLLMKKSSAVVFPKVDGSELGLMHGFLHLQVCFFGGMDWAIELQLSDQHQVHCSLPRSKEGLPSPTGSRMHRRKTSPSNTPAPISNTATGSISPLIWRVSWLPLAKGSKLWTKLTFRASSSSEEYFQLLIKLTLKKLKTNLHIFLKSFTSLP